MKVDQVPNVHHVEPGIDAHVEPGTVAHVEPGTVAHVEPATVAHVEPGIDPDDVLLQPGVLRRIGPARGDGEARVAPPYDGEAP
ncbi:hypothetical protein ABT215_32780, partial [Streptomyces sp900105755]